MHRIYHDFNKTWARSEDGKIWTAPLVCMGTKNDLDALGIALQEGMQVLLYMPDEGPGGFMEAMEVQATVRYDAGERCFMADYVRDELMYRSEANAKVKPSPNNPSLPMPVQRPASNHRQPPGMAGR